MASHYQYEYNNGPYFAVRCFNTDHGSYTQLFYITASGHSSYSITSNGIRPVISISEADLYKYLDS